MIPEELDLMALAEELRQKLEHLAPHGYLRGKSLMRDVLVHENGFSELEAEEAVDTMEAQGYLKFLGNPAERSHADDTTWDIEPHEP